MEHIALETGDKWIKSFVLTDLAPKYTFWTMTMGNREGQYFSTSCTWKMSFTGKKNGSVHGAS